MSGYAFGSILSAKLVEYGTAKQTTVELNASRGEAQHVFEIGSLVS